MQQTIKEILQNHRTWLEYEGKKGKRADFRDFDLQGADLQGVNLRKADLQQVNLQGANLQEADLRGANLQEADLRIAYLRLADLRGAIFSGANLRGADLWVADLRGAVLSNANLREANLQEADLRDARLDDANLKYAKITKNTLESIPESIRMLFTDDWYVIGVDDQPVSRFIEIAPRYFRSGVDGLLQFAGILRDGISDPPPSVRIEVAGSKMTLFVNPADGPGKVIEHDLVARE